MTRPDTREYPNERGQDLIDLLIFREELKSPANRVSLLSALNLHGMIDQIPRVAHVVTRAQRPSLRTPIGSYEFYRIQADLFGGFRPYRRTGNFAIATPEKAVFDTLYFSARKGRRFAFLPELELPARFSVTEVERWIALIKHSPLRIGVRERWKRLADSVSVRG